MAIAFDTTTPYNRTTGITSKTFAHTCTGANLVLLVIFTTESATDVVSGVTYNGVSMSRILASQRSAGVGDWTYMYGLIAPATGSNNVVVSFSSSTNSKGFAVSYTGVSQSGLPDATNTKTVNDVGTSNPVTYDVTSVAANCWAIYGGSAVGSGGSTITPTVNSGGTERSAARDSQPAQFLFDSNTAITGLNTLSLNWSATLFDTNVVMCTLAPALTTPVGFYPVDLNYQRDRNEIVPY